MKKHMAILLIIAMALTLAACQETPDEVIVVKKDTERMIEQAQQGNQKTTLSEQLNAPQEYSSSFSDADGKMLISVDAEVLTPDLPAIPIYRVNSAGFSEAFANAVFRELCGDTTMYLTSSVPTQEEIMNEIMVQKQRLATLDSNDAETKEIEAYIDLMETAYQTAPSELNEAVENVVFRKTDNSGSSYYGFEAREDVLSLNGKRFFVKNDADTQEVKSIDGITIAPRSNAALIYADNGIGPGAEMTVVGEVEPGQRVEQLKTTPEQAHGIAAGILERLGVDYMGVARTYLVAGAAPGSGYGYHICLQRAVDGIPVASPGLRSYVGEPAYGYEWNYETLYIGVCDDGIYRFEWNAPIEIKEQAVQNAALKPFDEIMAVFTQMMCIVNEPAARISDQYRTIEYKVTDISLTLQRISEQDSVHYGLLTPVWNFYGDIVYTRNDGTSYTYSEMKKAESADLFELNYPFLTINAVDGSIIDPQRGY